MVEALLAVLTRKSRPSLVLRRDRLHRLPLGAEGVVESLQVEGGAAQRLSELGFLPGHIIVPARSAPGGEPRVYRVDGSEVALRRETAAHLILRAKEDGSEVS